MALVSPGVEVTIIDQSQYLPAPTNSIPFVVLATATNKADPNGVGIAPATTPANAGKLYRVTSQRDLTTLYGNPFFYTTSNGTSIQGYELNEYGLLAAYSALGASNTIYCLRADVDLASLVGSTGRPSGNPADGTYWLDTTQTAWGIYEFDATTGKFNVVTPIVITDSALISSNAPLQSVGQIGDYAVIAIPSYAAPSAPAARQYFYKNNSNTWVVLGSSSWLNSWPTIQGTQANPTLTAGDNFVISINGDVDISITVASSPNNTVANIATQINALGYTYVSAEVVSGKLNIYSQQTAGASPSSTTPLSLTITADVDPTDTVLADLGIAAGTYYQPGFTYGTSAQQPLWQAGQTYARPTGSVWLKVGNAGNGLDPIISQWDNLSSVWVPVAVNVADSDWAVTAAIDSTGGQNINAGTVYAQYAYDGQTQGPVYYWERLLEGPTTVTGTNTSPTFTAGPYVSKVQVSVPGSSSLSAEYTLTVPDNATATGFVTAWSAAGIPYTTASVTDTGAIAITHTEGGVIIINDYIDGVSNGLSAAIGLVINTTTGVKYGPFATGTFTPTATSVNAGPGTGLELNVINDYQLYYVDPDTFVNPGSGYTVGNLVTFSGTQFGGTTPANDLVVEVTSVDPGGFVTGITYISGSPPATYSTQLSNWVEFDMTANEGAIVEAPADDTNWFYSVIDEVDIMVNTASGWRGYKISNYDNSGFPIPTGVNATDPAGPLVSPTAPTVQSDGTALVPGDIWIDTSDLDNYPIINRWQVVDGTATWVLINNSDQTSSTGVLFADARWATSGTVNPSSDPIPSIISLLSSNYLDLDAPESSLYPVGMLLFNTRRSGYNVKKFKANYFNNDNFPGESLPTEKDAWVSDSGLQTNGAPYMGRKAQRAMVVKAMKAAIDSNTAIRDEDNFFNLIAAPNYPELQPNMIVLNADRGETGFIIGDTPMRLPDSATAIQAWATNAADASETGEDGLVTRNSYLGLFYPSGITNDLQGNQVVVPPSHMMIRTFLRNDAIAYPWFAPAGTRRGTIDNASSIGYISPTTGEFISIKTRIGIRDVLYTNQINPIVFFTGNGLLNYGNKSSFNSQSALDRVNVARLVAYLRRQLTIAARPFVFEPNDAYTRSQISSVIQTLLVDLVAKRGVYDYLVVCDESNNTPARIDRNELWVDVAIEPVKAVEFIYIPVRIFNTGEIGNQAGSTGIVLNNTSQIS